MPFSPSPCLFLHASYGTEVHLFTIKPTSNKFTTPELALTTNPALMTNSSPLQLPMIMMYNLNLTFSPDSASSPVQQILIQLMDSSVSQKINRSELNILPTVNLPEDSIFQDSNKPFSTHLSSLSDLDY